MVEIELDGEKIEVKEGSMVMHAAEAAGKYIPHFCYHKKLTIAANCRMCLVDVEKAPKPMPACATPVTQGMVVRTHSDKAVKAQKSVMEFLLINHPLDCPICDQGGECQLQDLAVGYGGDKSRYDEEKRAVKPKEVGPLISMEAMSRCIQCTRCVRFGQEVAGVMELGMAHRGEHSEIETFVGNTVNSEISGNMIDICPVGALTSKPFRFSARTWELSRRKSISPHDSTGSNLIVQVKGHKVMRVLPLENEEVNECWLADRDRFSYEALDSADRLHKPMLKQDGKWLEVEWTQALEYVAHGLRDIAKNHGAASIGTLASPHSTVEELYLAGKLMRGMGSDNIDSRLRQAQFAKTAGARWLGMPIAELSNLSAVLVVGSNLRKDHPLFAQRIRQAARKGCAVYELNESASDWAMPIKFSCVANSNDWLKTLQEREVSIKSALKGEKIAILLGNAVAHHPDAEAILEICNQFAASMGATVGFLGEAANTVGAQIVAAQPQADGLNAAQMLRGDLQAAILLNTEPAFDSAYGVAGLQKAKMVVSLSPFKANAEIADVMLPIAPFTETSGTFVNAEGRAQSFYGVVPTLGETRPAWKVLRVLGNMLGLPDFDFNSTQEIAAQALPADIAGSLSNVSSKTVKVEAPGVRPVVASIYQLDSLVRRAPSLQETADAKNAERALA